MWKQLPQHGMGLRELRIEGSGRSRDVVLVPLQGERLRFPTTDELVIETSGNMIVRSSSINPTTMRVSFSAGELRLQSAEVLWSGSEEAWSDLWRRAHMRSLPWWREEEQEIELDWVLQARLLITGATV